MTSVWGELKRRNVVRVAIAYAIAAWLLIEITATTFPILKLPDWSVTLVTVLVLIGFPLALILAWAFELTPEGIKKEKDVDRSESITHITSRKLDFLIIGVLTIALAIFALDKFVWTGAKAPIKTTNPEQRSIAVLPFVNLSSDKEQEYFADGLTEEMLNLLASIPELKVTSRSSAFFYKGKDTKIADIGRELNVDHVLEGSVRRSGDTVRITAQLIDVANDAHIWSNTWDRTFEDIFVIQDEIAQAVVDSLRISLLDEVPRVPETSPEAYTLYLQAGQLFNLRNDDGIQQAEKLLKRALEIDSRFIPAWSLLIRTYFRGAGVGTWHPLEAYPMASAAAEQILELDANNVDALLAIADVAQRADYDYESGRTYLEHALKLAPADRRIRQRIAMMPGKDRDLSDRISYFEERITNDPTETGSMYVLGQAYLMARRFDEAEATFRKTIALSPSSSGTHFYLGAVLLLGENFDEALAQMNLEVRDGYVKTGRALVFQAMGETDRAAAELAELIDIGYRWTYQIAVVYAFRGEADNAFLWLDRAIERRDTSLFLIQGDPFMDGIRDDPRFLEVLKKIGRAN